MDLTSFSYPQPNKIIKGIQVYFFRQFGAISISICAIQWQGKTFSNCDIIQLKCVIARITHACYLAPKGLYRVTEADPTSI